MKDKIIVCKEIGIFSKSLTRGKKYIVLEEKPEKNQIKILGDNHRKRWYPASYFIEPNINIPVLVSWKFDENFSEKNLDSFIEVSFHLSDGTQRWCNICSEEGIFKFIKKELNYENFVYIKDQIIVKDFKYETVDKVLHYLDQQDLLISASLILENNNQ